MKNTRIATRGRARILFLSLCVFLTVGSPAVSATNRPVLDEISKSIGEIYGLTAGQQDELVIAFERAFTDEFTGYVSGSKETAAAGELITDIIADALSGDLAADEIMRAALVCNQARELGAKPEYLIELYPYLLDAKITPEQLLGASEYIDEVSGKKLAMAEAQELLYHALLQGLKHKELLALAAALIEADREGIPVHQFALAVLIRLEKGLTVPVEQMLREEITHVKRLLDTAAAEVPGVPAYVIEELHYYCFKHNLTDAQIKEVDNTLLKAIQRGIPPEKVALAVIMQLEKGYPGKTLSQMLVDELEHVRRLVTRDFDEEKAVAHYNKGYEYFERGRYNDAEREYLAALDYHPELERPLYWLAKTYFKQKRYQPAKHYLNETLRFHPGHSGARELLARIERKEREEKIHPTGTVFAFDPYGLNNAIERFIGVPYIWGGESHYGTDCSGLVWNLLNEIGFGVPRQRASDYYNSSRFVPVSRNDLRIGDLIFFDSRKKGEVTHVGLYLGNGTFVNARKSAGRVVIDPLDRPYWNQHWVGARRVKA